MCKSYPWFRGLLWYNTSGGSSQWTDYTAQPQTDDDLCYVLAANGPRCCFLLRRWWRCSIRSDPNWGKASGKPDECGSKSSVKARVLVLALPPPPPPAPAPAPPPSRWIEKALLVTCWCTKKPHLMCWCWGQTRANELSNSTRPREPDGVPGKELEMEYYKHDGDEVIWGPHCGTYQRLILAHGYMRPDLQTRQFVTWTQDLT